MVSGLHAFAPALAAAAVTVACTAEESSGETLAPTPPAFLVTAEPIDLQSSVAGKPLVVHVDNGTVVPDAVLNEIASSLELLTYPELEPVPATTTVVPSVPPDPDRPPVAYPARASVELHPIEPLASRWYALVLARLPEGTRATDSDSALGATGGVAIVGRFQPASAPVLREIRLCKSGSASRALVDFSEDIVVAGVPSSLLVAVGGSDTPCAWVQDEGAGPTQSLLYFDCPAEAWIAKRLAVTLEPGLTAAAGGDVGVVDSSATTSADVADPAGASHEVLDFEGAPSAGTDCLSLRPAL